MNIITFINYIKDTNNISLNENFDDSDFIKSSKNNYSFDCLLSVNDLDVPIKLEVDVDFPETLPRFCLSKYDVLGYLPHIEPDGCICYLEKESVYVNVEEPKAVFQASVELVIETLSNGISKKNRGDFREEFQSFWERNKYLSRLNVMSTISITDIPTKIQVVKDDKKAILYDLGRDVEKQKRLFFRKSPSFIKSGMYVPLMKDCELIPPRYDQQWEIDEFVQWLKPKVSSINWELLIEEIENKKPKHFEYLILGIPRISGATILVGIQLKVKKGNDHPFFRQGIDWKLNLFKISRFDKASILPRGGGDLLLQKKKVLLVGCGSVGSHVALFLVKTGLGALDLVDHDIFKIENLQRFSIGLEYIGRKKVDALKSYLDKNFIGTNVSVYSEKINEFLLSDDADLSNYDLIISATGDPTVNLSLNKKFKKLKIPFLVGWNEPYGIGGHSLLSIGGEKGCYRCLFRETYNIASFSAKDQSKPFHKKDLGCGEVFTPYNTLDSLRTSEIIVRLANNFLLGKIHKSQIISWVGESANFLEEGYKLSSRYINQTAEEMDRNKFNFINSDCIHCGK